MNFSSQQPASPFFSWFKVSLVFVIFLAVNFIMGNLHYPHVLFSSAIFILFALHPNTRLFLVLAIPILLQNVIFDSFRFVPFHWYLPIHVREPYLFDQYFFSIFYQGRTYLPHEFLMHFQRPLLDLISGALYNVLDPVVVLLVVLFWKMKDEYFAARYTSAFLLMNFFAFATYLFYPAAAPWYVSKYGFISPLMPVPGSPAGLARFDQLLGLGVSKEFYSMSPVVFGALPSMHAGFTMLGFLYSLKLGKRWSIPIGIYSLGMWLSALYLEHHYVIDILLGIFYALIAYILMEKCFVKANASILDFLNKMLLYPKAPCLLGKK
ncbi:MAG: phosphatase PAP2 family protein [Deltaproteobacteria bacterium]|nr:phosphatase PAP2 family protein [Deltaproteobacteria bacterium]